jgi:hypothetical protein
MVVTNGYAVISFGDPFGEGALQGNVAADGTFTGTFNYCGSPTPIPVTGTFSLTAPFTLTGSNAYGSVSVACQKE